MAWFYLSLFALCCFVMYDLLSRKIGAASKNPQAVAVLYNGIISVLTVFLFLLEPLPNISIAPYILCILVVDLCIWGAFGRTEYYAHKHVEASILTLILPISQVISCMLSILLFREIMTLQKLIGILIILGGNIFLIGKTSQSKLGKITGLKYAIIIAVLMGFGWTLDKYVAPFFGIALFSFFSFASSTVTNLMIPPISRVSIEMELRATHIGQLLILAVCNLAGYAAFVKALTLGEATRVVPIATATTPFVVIFGIILLHETSFAKTKIAVAFLTLVGIYLLK